VVEIPVRRVERMVDLEAAAVLDQEPVDDNPPVEDAGIASGRVVAEDRGTERPGANIGSSGDTESATAQVLAVHTACYLALGLPLDAVELLTSAGHAIARRTVEAEYPAEPPVP